MPLYDYECKKCGHEFEVLVRPGSEVPACTKCGNTSELQRLLTSFAVSTEGMRDANIKSARKSGEKGRKDQAIAQFEYEEKHRHHH